MAAPFIYSASSLPSPLASAVQSCGRGGKREVPGGQHTRWLGWAYGKKMQVGTHAAASPYREVVAEQLHDEGAVLVRVLVEGVELRNGVVKRLEVGE